MKSVAALLRYVSVPELMARPVRSLLMAGTVATGVALLTAMHVATHSIVEGFAGDLERLGGRADLQVTFGTGEAGFPEDLLAKVAAQPFTEQAAALVHSQATFDDGETVELFGIDLLQHDVLDLYEVEVLERDKDDFTILDDPRAVFVTDTVSKQRGLALGSKLNLAAVDGVHEYTVRGVVATRGLAAFLGGKLLAMYLPAAQPVAGRRGDLGGSMVDQIDIRLKAGADLEASRNSLDAMLGEGFRADTPMQRRMVGEHTVDGLRATLVGLSSLALLAAVFVIYASTTTMVVERLPAMATLATMGAGPGMLIRAILIEAALLGAAGSVVGVGIGLALASLIGADAAAGMGLNYSMPFDAARMSYDPILVFVGHPAGGLLTAILSAYLPARRLGQVNPLAIARDEDESQHRSTLSGTSVLLAAALVAIVGVVALRYGVARTSSEWISAGGMLLIGASVLAMLPLLKAGWIAAVPILASSSGMAGRIAGENLLRCLDRSLVTALAITLSVAITVGAGSLVTSFRASVADWYGFSGDALVSARSVGGGWLASPVSRELETGIRKLPCVGDLQTLRVLQGQPYRGERIAIAAVSAGLVREALAQASFPPGMDAAEAGRRIAAGEAVAVSSNFVTHFGAAEPGGQLSLATVTGEIALPVVAVVSDYVSDKGSVLLVRDLLASKWHDDLVNYYAVKLRDGSTLEELRQQVEASVAVAGALVVTSTASMIGRVDGLIAEAFADIDTIKLLVLFLTAIGIADLVVSNVLARRREIAVLRLVGFTGSQLVRTARLEGLCLTVGAVVCGSFAGTVCAWVWVNYSYPALVGYVLDLKVAWGSIALSTAAAIGMSTLSATVAARYALKQPELVAIRFE